MLDLLSRHKAGIVTLLRPADDGWSAEDWHVFFDERAGIAEFDGGLPRGQAEARAFACCVGGMAEPQSRALAAGPLSRLRRRRSWRTIRCLPFGIETTGHAWLHSRCWPAWYAGRKAEAVAALAAMGIAAPADLPDDFGKNGGA